MRDDQTVGSRENFTSSQKCYQGRMVMEAPSSWKIVKLALLRKPDAEQKKE